MVMRTNVSKDSNQDNGVHQMLDSYCMRFGAHNVYYVKFSPSFI